MSLVCGRCGAALEGYSAGSKVGRSDSCTSCKSDLHACLQCRHYDPAAYNGCREPQAERVVDKERANFCDYFSLSGKSGSGDTERAKAKAALDDLFK